MLKKFLPLNKFSRPAQVAADVDDPIQDVEEEEEEEFTAPTLTDVEMTPTPQNIARCSPDEGWPEDVFWILETTSRFLSPLRNVRLMFAVLEEDDQGSNRIVRKKLPADVYCLISACPILWPGERATRVLLVLHAQTMAIEVKKRLDHLACTGCRNIFAFRNRLIQFICRVLEFKEQYRINLDQVIQNLKEASVAYFHIIGLLLSEHFVTRDENTWLFEYLNSGSRPSCLEELKKSMRKRFVRRMEEWKETWHFTRGSVEDLWFLKTWQPKYKDCTCDEDDLK